MTLHEVPLNLPEITIESQRMAQKEIGNRSKAGFLISGFSHGDLGGEVGSKFSIKKESVIEEVGFYIKSNSFDTVKLRLNVYSVKERLPFQKLSSEEYITILKGQEGQMRLNLAKAVLTNEDVIVTLELVSHSPVNSGSIYFSQSPPYLGKMYYRETSLDKVKKYIGGPMSMYLSIKYEK
ncbi:MAG: hypothetical protein AAF843_04480 [Bacteroidota bacterium]